MKVLHLLPPAVALAASAAWLGSQQVRLNDIEEKMSVMTERVASYEALPVVQRAGNSSVEKEDPIQKFLLENGDFDWAAISKILSKTQNSGMPADMRTYLKIQEMILAMTVSEIETALRKIRQQPISNKAKENLEAVLLGVFVEKDPAAALHHFRGHLRDSSGALTYQLTRAFDSWLRQDSTAAMAWFDAQKKRGVFETKSLDQSSGVGRKFEVRLLAQLIENDSAAVRARLARLSEEERKSIIKSATLVNQGKGISEGALALIRENLSEEESQRALAEAFGQQVYSGKLPDLTEQTKNVTFEPAERAAILSKIVENFARPWDRKPADLVEVYTWAGKEAPGQEAELTGKAFARFAGHRNTDFEETFREVIQFSEKDPEILSHFAASLKDPQRHLESLKDETLQATYQDLIGSLDSSSDQ